ncbi:MAG: hypothetical protein O2923_12860 [Verrucomicrobia bacterium]|nr:hypothetical protein [Verrucomicrobiota bacterium]MDA1088125.1 hypothetical protein [Verrucomicrobiota bacterium]
MPILQRFLHATALSILTVCACLLIGCATATDDSDIPWGRPESWEGSPSIPGFNRGD